MASIPPTWGAYLARRIGDMVGVPAFFVDPVCVDELTEVAHYTGFAPPPPPRPLPPPSTRSPSDAGRRRPWASPMRRRT